ncbi:beta-L-arabinofuranosidase domain-containing protein [Cellvibrio fontiphilus]|uniref:Beta-L-arabinofuranosidase domain-containing protein n=1 Tax=Cellvibrio fontiphilus TaxID=1815559 RepID=A0ABV7FIZ8_9GAMM
MNLVSSLRLFTLGVSLCVASAQALELAPTRDVQLLDSPFLQAQNTNKEYLLAFDAEKMLAPFRREAGLPFKETYGNWESTGLDGHMGGHYVTALALLYAATQDKLVLERLNYVIAELKKCQDKLGTGYLGGIPDSNKMWSEIARGDIRADNFSTNERWVPWYNLHKIYAGLRDAYLYAGNEDAKNMLVRLSDWTIELTKKLSPEQMQTMLRTEHGGMNEVFVDVASITGDKKYLQLAEAFSHQAILQPLQKQQDQLTGLHANTQIPKIIGFKKVADATHNESWDKAAEFFWQTVVDKRTVAIGGNSVKEHFHDSNDFTPMIEDVEGPETCNTYNMLKLTQLLYLSSADKGEHTPAMKYVDYYERAVYNHILSSQHPHTGGLVYFTSMRPNHYRVYSQVHDAMWCCVGSGIESHSKYAEFIYARDLDKKLPEIFVNLFIPSRLNWAEQGISLTQNTQFPDAETTEFVIESSKRFRLQLRYPQWVEQGVLQLRVNGKTIKVKQQPGEFIALERRWKKGDKVELVLPMKPRLEKLPDGSNYYAVLYGPIVLAAKTQPFNGEKVNYFSDDSRMGHIASGQVCPLEAAPFLLGNSDEFIQQLKPVAGKPLTFNASGLINGQNLQQIELVPFFRVHESRYALYMPYSTAADIEKARANAAAEEKARLALQAKTIDQVAPGEQQPESDHFYKGEQAEAGLYNGRHWRHSRAWFSYELNDKNQEAKTLQITYAGIDSGRKFEIQLNGVVIAKVESTGNTQEFFTVDYPIPAELVKKAKGKYTLKFVAAPDSIAGGIYGVRLLR